MHVYEVRPRKVQCGVDLISDVLPFGRLWYGGPNAISNAISYAKFFSRSHDALIRVYVKRDEGDARCVAIPKFHECDYTQRRSALVETAMISMR